jgi:hypothetical protein
MKSGSEEIGQNHVSYKKGYARVTSIVLRQHIIARHSLVLARLLLFVVLYQVGQQREVLEQPCVAS